MSNIVTKWRFLTGKEAYNAGFGGAENGVLLCSVIHADYFCEDPIFRKVALLTWEGKGAHSWMLELHYDGEMIEGPTLFYSRADAMFVAESYLQNNTDPTK